MSLPRQSCISFPFSERPESVLPLSATEVGIWNVSRYDVFAAGGPEGHWTRHHGVMFVCRSHRSAGESSIQGGLHDDNHGTTTAA